MDAKSILKDLWKDMVLNYSDVSELFPKDQIKRKLKQLNLIVDEMTDEEVLAETEEISVFIRSFNKQ